MLPSLASVKLELRKQMAEKLKTLSSEARAKAERDIALVMSAHSHFRKANSILMYAALAGELSLSKCMEEAWKDGKLVALPRVEGPALKPYQIMNLESDVAPGSYHVIEPLATCRELPLGQIDLILVPGLAFDRLGWRLGRGKGYYDRLLNMVGESTYVIGVCYRMQVLEKVPYGANDSCVKEVVSV